jgi:hypothetical protein
MKKYRGSWTEKQLRHLLRRCLFGVTLDDYTFFQGKNMDQCLNILLQTGSDSLPPLYYKDLKTRVMKVYQWGDYNRNMPDSVSVKASCIFPMINQRRNITERMVLFWHNHFATRYDSTKNAVYTFQYFLLLRKHADGNFKNLLREMTTNIQMLLFLNGDQNNKDAPNENYARELQELFSIGKGPESHYDENDVHAIAKILTGWKIEDDKLSSYFDPNFHDASDKVFSAFYGGQTIKGRKGIEGSQETDDLIDMICAQEEVSKFICRKLYRWFVHSTIDEQVEANVITVLSEILIKSEYEVKPVLMALLSGDFFYEPHLTGSIIKSPLDFMVGLTREFKLINDEIDTQRQEGFLEVPFNIAFIAGKMGQDICDPPSVAGWPAYYEYPLYDREWLTYAVSGRAFWINALISPHRPDEDFILRLDLVSFIKTLSNPGNATQLIAEAINLLYAIPSGPSQISYLQNLLDTGVKVNEKWNELWQKYSLDKSSSELILEINTRLKSTFLNLLTYPEYQIR